MIRLLFVLHREVLLVCDERSGELLHFKVLGSPLLLPSEDVWLCRGEKWAKWSSWGSNGSVVAVRGLNAWAGEIPLRIQSLNILWYRLRICMVIHKTVIFELFASWDDIDLSICDRKWIEMMPSLDASCFPFPWGWVKQALKQERVKFILK